MAIDFLSPIDYNGVPSIAFAVPLAASDPTGYTGGIYYNTTTNVLKFWDGATWITLGQEGAGGPPSGGAGGDLTGNYPNPTIKAGAVTDAKVSDTAAIAQSKIAGLSTSLNAKADKTTSVLGGAGLSGGGDLSGDVTLDVGAGTGITVTADGVEIDRTVVNTWYDPAGSAAARVLKGGDTMTGDLAMSGKKVTALPGAGAGTFTANDAAPVWYVDQHSVGLKPIDSARVLSKDFLPALSGLLTIDDITLVAGDRVLVAGQSNGSTTVGDGAANGIYIAAAGAWTRAPDADAEGDLEAGNFIFVSEGTLWGGTGFLVLLRDAQAPWTPNVDDNYWLQLHSRPGLDVGNGLVQTGKRVDVVTAAGGGLIATEDDVSINRTVTDTWYVQPSRAINTNATMSGGGNLSADRTLSVVSAPKWTTARTITLAGEVTGTTTIDGSANVTINTTVAGATNLVNQYAADVGAGTNVVVNHNLGSRDVSVTVYRATTPWDSVLVDVDRTTTNQITLKFATAVTAGQYRVVVQGK